MKKSKTRPKQTSKLRKRIEEFLQKNPAAIKKIPPEDVRNLFEDLQIYQAELEKYNNELQKVHKQLQDSEEKYRQLFATISDAIMVFDAETKEFIDANDAVSVFYGYTKEEFLELKHTDITAELEKSDESIRQTVAGEISSIPIRYHKRKDGTILPVEISTGAFKLGNRQMVYGVARNITKRRKTEDALSKQTHALGERIKELNCLYGISKIRERNDIAFEEMLQEIVDLIPPSWQYPEITCARIIIEGQEYKTKNFKETTWKQTSNIVVHGKRIGILEICYLEEKPESDEGPFLKEERSLISAITERLGRVTEHKQAEGALRKAHDELEHRVKERTRELEINTNSLEEINTAMKVLLKKREEDKTEIEVNVLTNVKELISPYFEKIKKTKLDNKQETFLSILESNLNEIVSPFTRKMSLKYLNLTPTEIQIANLIRHGSSTKKIAKIMSVSPRTVETHRRNIRRKIGLEHTRANLRSHLLSLH